MTVRELINLLKKQYPNAEVQFFNPTNEKFYLVTDVYNASKDDGAVILASH